MKATAKRLLKRATRARWVHALVLTRVLVGALLLSGCVSVTAYEQANSATEVEREGRRRANVELAQSKVELARLEVERDDLAKKLLTEEDSMAASRLDVTTTQKERDQQAELVEQLRGDLARVGEHLKTFVEERATLSDEKQVLEVELSQARVEVTRLQAQMKDVTAEPAQQGETAARLETALGELNRLQEQSEANAAEQNVADAPSSP